MESFCVVVLFKKYSCFLILLSLKLLSRFPVVFTQLCFEYYKADDYYGNGNDVNYYLCFLQVDYRTYEFAKCGNCGSKRKYDEEFIFKIVFPFFCPSLICLYHLFKQIFVLLILYNVLQTKSEKKRTETVRV